ncbi:6311_t:CDS:10 [Dentiscutata heterogama]|uniref:6311_t:CDS:1 n=1 Tax=Dentiscutata heterogama TaxID=1316150 RepID=A0ACA9JVX1_9GLOM|nr:6311_t:CDS:10 [Dentiscutata heterogama]
MADIKKRLVFSILQFLQQSIKDGTIKGEDTESVEVAVQCIGEAFGVNTEDPDQKALYATKAPLLSIFEVAVKAQERITKAPTPKTTTATKTELSEEQKKKAEELKAAGNVKVSEKDYKTAVKLYSEAIAINENSAIYYANRAAAYSQLGEHDKAIEDAIKSSQIDPSYSKAYSRLGHAYFSVGKYREAVEAYEKGLSLDPNNPSMKTSLATAEQKASELTDKGSSRSTPTSGGGAGLGGAFNNIMNNPNIAEMAQNMMREGQPPNINELMNNPDIMNMARQFASNQSGDGDNTEASSDNAQ